MTPEQYTQDLKYLPDFMKDFHDQKKIFKTIQELYEKNDSLQGLANSWSQNHIYVIDYFLWFMGQHGFKLQRDRSNVEFYNLQETLDSLETKRIERFSALIKSPENPLPNG
jgi:hypothetical protein